MSILNYIDSSVFAPELDTVKLFSSPNLMRIVNELYFAIRNNLHIFIYGDYDVDGFSAMQVIMETLKLLNYKNYSFYKYSKRTHKLQLDVLKQSENAHIVIVCDTGSSKEDSSIIAELQARHKVVLVLDHHNCDWGYENLLYLTPAYNSYEENQGPMSGAATTFQAMALLCLRLDKPISNNAKFWALASMYADNIDLAHEFGLSLYNDVAKQGRNLPPLGEILNQHNYMIGRRLFSYLISPVINSLFRGEGFSLLNTISSEYDKHCLLSLRDEAFKHKEKFDKDCTEALSRFQYEHIGSNILLAVYHLQPDDRFPLIRNFSGLIANKLAQAHKKIAIVLIHTAHAYEGSLRDYYNRKLLHDFQLFADADGHDTAFGLNVSEVSFPLFREHVTALSSALSCIPSLSFQTISSQLITTEEDVRTLALYNEYMNFRPLLYIDLLVQKCKVVRTTSFYKIYDVGLPLNIIAKSSILPGTRIILEPCICKQVELREVVTL